MLVTSRANSSFGGRLIVVAIGCVLALSTQSDTVKSHEAAQVPDASSWPTQSTAAAAQATETTQEAAAAPAAAAPVAAASSSVPAASRPGGRAQSISDTLDLKRLVNDPAGGHETRVHYQNIPLNLADLMMASHSMPAGRRRLDTSSDELGVGVARLAPHEYAASNQALLDLPWASAGEPLLTAAAALSRDRLASQQRGGSPNDYGGSPNDYGGIVDAGTPPGRLDGRFPSPQLMAKLANDNFNRMALASALRDQQALIRKSAPAAGPRRRGDDANRKRPKHFEGVESRHSQARERKRLRQVASDEMRRASLSPVSETGKRLANGRARGSGGRANRDELEAGHNQRDSPSRSGASDEDEDERSTEAVDGASLQTDDELDGLGGDGRANRRSSDPFFDDAEDEDRREAPVQRRRGRENGAGDDEALAQLAAMRPRLAAGRGQKSDGRQPRRPPPLRRNNGGSGAGERDNDDDEDDGANDIESMISRKQLVTTGDSLRRSNNGQDDASLARWTAAAATGARVNKARRRPANKQRQRAASGATRSSGNANLSFAEDSDLSASHIRNSATDLQTAAGHHHHGHGHYYQFVEVPKKKAWKYGFKRGNHKHTIEKHEKGYKSKFHTQFKWHAKEKCKKKSKCESVGKMSWDYKHHDKKHHHG